MPERKFSFYDAGGKFGYRHKYRPISHRVTFDLGAGHRWSPCARTQRESSESRKGSQSSGRLTCIMAAMSVRTAARGIGWLGLLSASFLTALAAHALLGGLQAAGLLQGDYGSHAHGSVLPVTLCAVTAISLASLCYVLHLAGLERGALPHVARALRARVGWQTVLGVAAIAVLCLAGMETAEQFAAGHFDGLASAFSSSPVIGLVAVAALAIVVNGLAGSVCGWLAGAHERIVRLLAYALRTLFAPSARPASSYALAAVANSDACRPYLSRVHGRRGPPVPR